MTRRLAMVVLAVTALVSGCARSAPKAAPVKSQTLDRTVSLRVTGARTFTYAGTASLAALAREGEGELAASSAVAVNTAKTLVMGDVQLRVDIGLVGGYHGSGTYEVPVGLGFPIPTAGPTAPSPKTALQWGGSLTFSRNGVPFARYGYVAEPCKLVFDKDATEGSMSCSKLLGVDGSAIAVEMTWKP